MKPTPPGPSWLYICVMGAFWFAVAREYEWSAGVLVVVEIFSAVAIDRALRELRPRPEPPIRAYETTDLPFRPRGRQLVIDLTGIPEGNKDLLEIFVSREGVRVIASGPHLDVPVEAHDGWGPHCVNTSMGRSQAQIMRGAVGESACEVPVKKSLRADLEAMVRADADLEAMVRADAPVDSSDPTSEPSSNPS